MDSAEMEWQIPYQALTAFSKASAVFPELVSSAPDSAFPWNSMFTLLLHPHAWVCTAACRLLGTFFATVPVAAPSGSLDDSEIEDGPPLSAQGMRVVANALALQLKSEHLNEALGTQVAKNLPFNDKCFAAVTIEPVEAGYKGIEGKG